VSQWFALCYSWPNFWILVCMFMVQFASLCRSCWKCKKSFIKDAGCNKMTCTCGAIMCYICRQPVTSYSHFNGQGGSEFHKWVALLCQSFWNALISLRFWIGCDSGQVTTGPVTRGGGIECWGIISSKCHSSPTLLCFHMVSYVLYLMEWSPVFATLFFELSHGWTLSCPLFGDFRL
jgi:hypothetical protein